MRLIYFHQHFATPRGSGGIRSYQMARELVRRGHSVTMVCGSHKLAGIGLPGEYVDGCKRGMIDGIDVIEFDLSYSNRDGLLKRSLTFLKYAWNSILVALREEYDLAFATTTPLTAAIPVLAARLLRGKRYVFEVRDLWPEIPREMGVITNPLVLGAMSVLEFLAYRGAAACVALSPGIADGIARRGVSRERIAMVPNGCDIDLMNAAPEGWRPESIGRDKFLAVFPGAHGPANGLRAVLDAAIVLKDRGRSDIAIALVGDGKEKDDLVAYARRENLDNVHFHNPVPKRQVAGLLAEADVGLQVLANIPAFYYGTSPNKFFDYIASGTPVVTNYPGWVADLVTEHSAGLAVPPGEPEKLAEALMTLADDAQTRASMAANAGALASDRFDRSLLAQEWSEFVLQQSAEKSLGKPQ